MTKLKRLCLVVLLVSSGAPVFAQAPKAEVGGVVGWVFSDGVHEQYVCGPGLAPSTASIRKILFGWGFDGVSWWVAMRKWGFSARSNPPSVGRRHDHGGYRI
jgi:hypothetical protein